MSAQLALMPVEGNASRRPRDVIELRAQWAWDAPVDELEVRLFWYTIGKGREDFSVVELQSVESPLPNEARSFRFTLPEGPYSFVGKLALLQWAIELIAGKSVARWEFTLGPEGRAIELG
jgi:hypothetical protein